MDQARAARAMDALGHEARLAIFRALVRAGDGGLAVAGIQERLAGMPRSTLAHHLGKLLAAELVTQEKVGAAVVTRANFELIRSVVWYLVDECCADERVDVPTRGEVA